MHAKELYRHFLDLESLWRVAKVKLDAENPEARR